MTLVKGMDQVKRKAARDEDTVAEGMRRIDALGRKLTTYKYEHRQAPRAAAVDQAVADHDMALKMESDWGKDVDEFLQKMTEFNKRRRMLQQQQNVSLFEKVGRIFEETMVDPEGTFAQPDQDPPMPQELMQFTEDADVGQEPIGVNASDRCQVIIKSGARKGLACGRPQPCKRHRIQR